MDKDDKKKTPTFESLLATKKDVLRCMSPRDVVLKALEKAIEEDRLYDDTLNSPSSKKS